MKMSINAPTTATPAKRRLGRGLGSLLSTPVQVPIAPASPQHVHTGSTVEAAQENASPDIAPSDASTGISLLDVKLIFPNPKQPRQVFDETALKLLASSIAKSGLMQPIVVRPAKHPSNGVAGFQIIAGERRWRAAQIAGLARIPAAVREVDDRTAAELSLVENLQREDLNPMERAEAFLRLIDDFGLMHQEIAEQVGIDRSSVTNYLRLNELDEPTKQAVRDGLLSMGHAKALLAITNIKQRGAIAASCVRAGWSVRELERRAKQNSQTPQIAAISSAKPLSATAANTADLERRLAEHLGTKVKIHSGRNKGSGRLVIEFFNIDQFEGLLRQMQFDAS